MKILVLFSIIFFDQLTKYIINQNLQVNTSYNFLFFIDIVNIQNRGISFGFFSDAIYSKFILFTVAAIIMFLIYWYFTSNKILEKWGVIIIIGGAVGNFIDRILNNYVVDFLYFHYKHYYWPAFNIADVSITIGVIILVIATYMEYRYKKNDNE